MISISLELVRLVGKTKKKTKPTWMNMIGQKQSRIAVKNPCLKCLDLNVNLVRGSMNLRTGSAPKMQLITQELPYWLWWDHRTQIFPSLLVPNRWPNTYREIYLSLLFSWSTRSLRCSVTVQMLYSPLAAKRLHQIVWFLTVNNQ